MDNQNPGAIDNPPVNRFLVWAVYVMGALFVLLFIGLIVGIAYKIKHRINAPSGTGQIELSLPPDVQAREATIAGDKLTINTGSEVFVIDITSRQVLLRVKLGGP